MTPKEKAKELFEAYLNVGMGDGWAKECALIAINFTANSLDWHLYPLDTEWRELNEIEEEIKNL